MTLTKKVLIKAGQVSGYQVHFMRDEIWTVIDGSGDLLLDGHARSVKRGDVVRISKGCKHSVRAKTNLYLIVVQIGVELTENDVEFYDVEWQHTAEVISGAMR